jgi:hypothetical protein
VDEVDRRRFLASTAAVATAIARPIIGEITSPPAEDHAAPTGRRPVIDVTDLYHPYQDPGDNFDLVHAYSLPEIDLRAIVLDVTQAFRLPVANDPLLWHDPNGPREPGIVPVTQLNALFDRTVPFAVSPFSAMTSMEDDLRSAPKFQQAGIELLIATLKASEDQVDIVSFGSCRSIAAALNREPALLLDKVRRVHVSAGTASANYELGASQEHNTIPGGEWNVALDLQAFRRLLASELNLGLYPCASIDGAFAYGVHNTYWNLPDRHFLRDIDPRLRNYLLFALGRQVRPDFLRCLEEPMSEGLAGDKLNDRHHVWETAIWLEVSQRKIIQRAGKWSIIAASEVESDDRILTNQLRPCRLKVREDGRIAFRLTDEKSNISIFMRSDPKEYEAAMREAWPAWWKTLRTSNNA